MIVLFTIPAGEILALYKKRAAENLPPYLKIN